MTTTTPSRRQFMGAAAALSYSRIPGANDRIRIGIVGFSDRFRDALLPAFNKVAPGQNAEIVALSDIWSVRRDEGLAHIAKATGTTIAGVRNNDELYDRKDVDAVIISTADFQHAPHGVEAVRAGRDAYIEKPLANTMADARAILKAVEETRRVVQIGTQRRSSPGTHRVRELIASGRLGDILMARFAYNANQPLRWRRPQLIARLRPADTDWNRFRLARLKEWNPHHYIEFRLYWPCSSGIADQWMVHQIDALHFITGLSRPRSVVAKGGIYSWRDGRVNPDTLTAVFDYGPLDNPAKGFQTIFSGRMGNAAEPNNDVFYFNGGTLDMRAGKVTSDGGLIERHAAAAGLKPNLFPEMSLKGESTGLADDSVQAHLRNWLECIRSRKTPVADVRAGYNHSVALSMTIAALHSGRTATFDEARQEVVV